MPDFSELPVEIRLEIWLQIIDSTPPRVVEIYVRDKRAIPANPPPPIVHVNRESRHVALSIYKPWLSQFPGTPEHAPYAELFAKHDQYLQSLPKRGGRQVKESQRPISCLSNVIIDFERDTLLLTPPSNTYSRSTNWWPMQLFGPLEESCLRTLAVKVPTRSGWVEMDERLVSQLCRLRNLQTVYLFGSRGACGDTFSNGLTRPLLSPLYMIYRRLMTIQSKDILHPQEGVVGYVAPAILGQDVVADQTFWRTVQGESRLCPQAGPDAVILADTIRPQQTFDGPWTTYRHRPRAKPVPYPLPQPREYGLRLTKRKAKDSVQ